MFRLTGDEDKARRIKNKIAGNIAERKRQYGDIEKREKEAIGSLLSYGEREMENISYDLYNARKFVKIFPEEAASGSGKSGILKRFYQKVVRRVLRQQIVFNQSVVGTLNDLNERLAKVEDEMNRSK